ncbi:hypothetical protein VNO80_07719 [Phaseolus coccineus]|uniref:Uncharacterized protein n=1 Tax=Phaseolus coccineus TaxID=3886 RepID=A0AAN9NKB1_PHACN
MRRRISHHVTAQKHIQIQQNDVMSSMDNANLSLYAMLRYSIPSSSSSTSSSSSSLALALSLSNTWIA